MIDRSGQWWTGEDFGDLAEHLRVVTAEGYPANRIRQSVCSCGGTTHRLDADPVESVAQRTCVACGTSAFIADSDEHWSEARAERWHCACENDTAELGARGRLLPEERRRGPLDHPGAALYPMWPARRGGGLEDRLRASTHLLAQV